MGKDESDNATIALFAGGAAVALVGGAFAWSLLSRNGSGPVRPTEPADPARGASVLPYPPTDDDVEALARMFASENPRGSTRLQVELAWTQIRSRRPSQSLYDRITGGSGYGEQGEKRPGGRLRPVATTNNATAGFRALARRVLAGIETSRLAGARQFFEPRQSDLAFAVGVRAREKASKGLPLTKQEQRLRHYYSDAAGIRRRWTSEGHRKLDLIEGVEFYT